MCPDVNEPYAHWHCASCEHTDTLDYHSLLWQTSDSIRHHHSSGCRAVIGFLKVVRPLNSVDIYRVRKAQEWVRALSLGGLGGPPHENFVTKDD